MIRNSRCISTPTTLLFYFEDLRSVVEVLIILKWFEQLYHMDISNDKTNAVKIRVLRSIPWQGKFVSKWATTFKIDGIYYDINKMGFIY